MGAFAESFSLVWSALALPALIAFGLVFGSFLGCYLYRWPRGIGMWSPKSSCFNCRKLLKWYELIPLLSFIIQCGKCNKCGIAVGWGTLLVELWCLFLALGCWLVWGANPPAPFAFLAVASLSGVVWIFVRWRRLPYKLLLFSLINMGIITFLAQA